MRSDVVIESYYLRETQFGKSLRVSLDRIGGMTKLDSILHNFRNEYEFRLTTYLAEHVIVDKKAEWPATWWDALKDRFMPKAWRKYFPIKYNRLEVLVSEIATQMILPESHGPIPFLKWDNKSFVDSGPRR